MKIRIKLLVLKLLINLIHKFKTSRNLYLKKELTSKLKKVGTSFRIDKEFSIVNPKYVEIGHNFSCKQRVRIEAIDQYNSHFFSPLIFIGNNVSFNTDIHIGCIDSIRIGDNCLFASRIFISDHNHGDSSFEMLKMAPEDRPLISKGPVVIKNNVWVGEGVAILSGVTIGENSIISTNAVVTKSVPPNVVVGGVPAKIIKHIK